MKSKLYKAILLFFLIFFSQNSLLAQLKNYDGFKKYIKDISEAYPQHPDSIILIYNQILQTKEVQADLNKQTYVFLYLGNVYSYEKAEGAIGHTYFQKSLELAHKTQNCVTEINSLIGLTLFFYELKKLDSLINYYEKAAQLIKDCPLNTNELYIYTQLGINYSTIGNLKKAELNFKMGDSVLILNKIDFSNFSNFFYTSIINFYKKVGNKGKVLFYLQKAKRRSLSNIQSQVYDGDLSEYLFIIEIFKSIGQTDSALYYGHLLHDLPMDKYADFNKKLILGSNDLLANLYFEKGDLEKAYYYKNIYATILDSVIHSSISEKANDKVKILENELLLEKQKNQASQNKIIAISISLLAFIALIVLVLFYKNAQKLQKLNTTLENQKQELTSLNEIRTRMFSVLSHDLRSPIGALKNMIELYQMKSLTKIEFDTYTVDLKQNLDAILINLNNILDWSYAQLKGKKPFFDTLDVQTIVNDQLKLQLEMARQKNIELINDVPADFNIYADVNQFSLIVRNLLNNALKYTPNGGKVEIKASNTEGGKTIEIKDNGLGMSEQKVQQLFSSTEKRSFTPHGKGLGLEMVNDFIKANNCTLSVKSKENEGSVFTLFFPHIEP